MAHRQLTPSAIRARALLALASSYRSVRPLAWKLVGEGKFSSTVEVGPSDYMIVVSLSAPGLVLLDGASYYEVDREHTAVPLPPGRHIITLELSPYGDFGEPVRAEPPRAYLASRDEDAYMLFLYTSSLLDLAQASGSQQVASDIYQLLTDAYSRVHFYSASAEQLEIASSLYRTNMEVWRVVQELRSLQAPEAGEAYREGRLEGAAEALKVIREGLATLRGRYGKLGEAVVVGHAHIDAAWLWPFEESRRKVRRTVAAVVNLMKRFPEMRFIQSSALYYEWLSEDDPALLEEVRRLVREGRWELGAGYVEFDANLTPGEAIARQLLYSQRLYMRLFGTTAEVLWLPDSFGFMRGLAQLARLGGVRYFATHKLSWNDTNRFPFGVFDWVGPDGGRLRSVAFGYGGRGYNATFWPSDLLQQRSSWPDRLNPVLYAYGYGDGGGGPNEDMLLLSSIVNEEPLLPVVKHGTVSSYMSMAKPIGEWQEALYVETHRGTYTSHVRMKALHEEAVAWLREAELWTALAGSRERLEGLWKRVLRDEFHDVLPGSAVREVYSEVYRDLEEVVAAARSRALGAASRLAGGGSSLMAFNSMPWFRSGYVIVDRPVGLSQEVEGGHLAYFSAPPLGWAPVGSDPGDSAWARDEGDRVVMGNRSLEVTIAKDGRITSLRLNGVEFLRSPGYMLTLYQNAPGWADAWDIEPGYESSARPLSAGEVRVAASGPLMAAASLSYAFGSSRVEVVARVYAGLSYVEFLVRALVPDREQMLRATFDLNVNSDLYAYGGPMSVLERPTACGSSWEAARFEVPFQKFIDVFDDGKGVAVLSPHVHGASACGSSLGLTLLRTPMFPDPLTDAEPVELKYAIMPHFGDWRSANVVRAAYDYWAPVPVVPGSGSTGSMGSLEPEGLVLESVKVAEDGDGLVFRVYETFNRGGAGALRAPFNVAAASSVDLLEVNEVKRDLEVRGDLVRFSYGPREVVTLLLRGP